MESTKNITFLTVSEFKSAINANSAEVIKNPNTNKLFLSADNGKNYKVQQDINSKLPMKVIVEDNNLDEACLINVKNTAQPVFSI